MKTSQRITPKIPEGMVELLKNLAKSVLKEQPENIYLFAAEYFENLVRERDGTLDKGYSTFRKYNDEIAKRGGSDVCPRCHCILHPVRKDEEPVEGEEDNSPRNDTEHALDMSVNGVAIKAMPRDGKSSKGQKNRQRLETIRSVSMDSAIEDDGKSQSTSPKPNSQDKPGDSALSLQGLSALGAVGAVGVVAPSIIEKNKAYEEKVEKELIEAIEEETTAESPVNDINSEPNKKLSTDDDIPETPTNDTSVSETITDRTVIEVAPLNSESKNEELNASDSTQVDELDSNVKSDGTDIIPIVETVVTEPIEEPTQIDDEVITTTEPTNFQLEQVKQMDRLRTPESDSGLSEKSFNLNIQENEETVTNEVNEIKDESFMTPAKLLSLKEQEFDATSKDDSGIVDVSESAKNLQLNTETENEPSNDTNEVIKSIEPSIENNGAKEEERPAVDDSIETDTEKEPQEVNHEKLKESEELSKAEELSKDLKHSEEIDNVKQPNETTLPSTIESQNAIKDIEKESPESIEKDSKPNSSQQADSSQKNSQTEAISNYTTPEQESTNLSELTDDQNKPESAQTTQENEAKTPEKEAQYEQKPKSAGSSTLDSKDEPDLKPSDEIQTKIPNENAEITSELEENEVEPSKKPKSPTENQNTESDLTTQANEVNSQNDDTKSQETNEQVNEPDKMEGDAKSLSVEQEKNDAEVEETAADSSKTLDEKPNEDSIEGSKVNETKSDEIQSVLNKNLAENVPKSADQIDQSESDLNETKIDTEFTPNDAAPTPTETEPVLTHAQVENDTTSKDKLHADAVSVKSNNEVEAESSSEKLLEEKNNKRNKREIGSFGDGSTHAEANDKEPNDAPSEETSALQVEESQFDAVSLKSNDLKSEEEKIVNENDTIDSNKNDHKVEKQDEQSNKEATSEKSFNTVLDTPENVEKSNETLNGVQGDTSNEIEPDAVSVDSKKLGTASSANNDQNELVKEDFENIEKNEPTKVDANDWEKTTDKIAKQVAERDANIRKVFVASLIGDKDEVNGEDTAQAELESSENIAKSDRSSIAEEEMPQNVPPAEQTVENNEPKADDNKQNKTTTEPDTPKMVEPSNADAKDTKGSNEMKSIDQNIEKLITNESKKDVSHSHTVDENQSDKPTSANASENDSRKNNGNSNKNDDKIDTASIRSEIHGDTLQMDTKSIDENDVEKIANETKTNESESSEPQITANEVEEPTSADRNKNDSNSTKSIQSDAENVIYNEQSETMLDLTVADGASDNAPPEASNDRSAVSNEPNHEVDSKFGKSDKLKEENPKSADLPENHSTSYDDLCKGDESANDSKNYESGNPSSQQPEKSNLVDEVKENQTILPMENTASHSEGVNENTEKSTMPTEQKSDDDSKHEKNQNVDNVNTSANDKVEKTIVNEKPTSAHSQRNIETKASNEIEQGNRYDARNANNDDVASELSLSMKGEYEQAETEFVANESIKDLDLSSNHEFDPNQASAESEQQITALEYNAPAYYNDSIDSPKQTQMQPDSLDMLIDSLDVSASLEPSVDADSLNIDSLEDKPRSAKSTDTGKLKDSPDSILEEVSSPITAKDDETYVTSANTVGAQLSTQNEPDRPLKNDTNYLSLLAVSKVKLSKGNRPPESTSAPQETVMGDVVDYSTNSDIMHDQMKNELEVLRLAENLPVPIQMLGISEIDSPVTPKQGHTTIFVSTPSDIKVTVDDKSQKMVRKESKDDGNQQSQFLDKSKNIEISIETDDQNRKGEIINAKVETLIVEKNISEQSEEKFETEVSDQFTEKQKRNAEQNTSFSESVSVSETNTNAVTEDQTEQSSEFYSTTIETSETQTSEDVIEVVEVVEIVETIKCVEYLKPISHDTPSSDLSDTDTTDKAEKVYTESGVDETSRDERDEVSEIENFDLSSCGEDSLEAMYYMIRKNEIIMDRHKQTSAKNCDDEKIIFPEKATDDLEHAIRQVSGDKKVKLCTISANSFVDDIVLKKISSDSDDIQIHVIPNSEIDSSSEPKSCPLKEQCTASDSTDDEYINPVVDSMRKKENDLNEMHAKALSVQPNRSDTQSDEQQLEIDTFNEMDDMMPGNIERKIFASSVSEADSDYFELPPTASRLTKDDFNVSTAFEHMIQAESSTDDSNSTIESAATKIQAGARGWLTRRRIRKSSAGTSASNEKRSSIGNAAIDKSLDNLIEQQELMEENGYSESFEDSSPKSHENQTMDSVDAEKPLGITEIKVEQRKHEVMNLAGNADSVNSDEKLPEINIQGISEESATAQRRLMLQRGDAMQRNSTPESSEQQQQQQQQQQKLVDKEKSCKEPNNEENNQDAKNKSDDDLKIDTPLANVSKSINKSKRGLGPRQRSMPVQIDAQLIRVLPKQVSKRVKSASSSSSKNHRPLFF